MVDQYTHPCLTNMCYVKGEWPHEQYNDNSDIVKCLLCFFFINAGYSKPSNDEIQKLAIYFNEHQTFLAESIEQENGAYVIHVNI